MSPSISGISFVPAPEHLTASGLVGWVSFLIDDALRADGVGVRRTKHGRFVLSYPLREDAAGKPHYALRPINTATRRLVEERVLGELGFATEEAS
ncbi:MAG: hypothetical protein IT459_20280 [Planctomycetes bacterium]|nr:hypothetical protein [Planctomycetota bacterium]